MKVLFACGTHKKNEELKLKALEYFSNNGFTILNNEGEFYHPLMRPLQKNGETIRGTWLHTTLSYLTDIG